MRSESQVPKSGSYLFLARNVDLRSHLVFQDLSSFSYNTVLNFAPSMGIFTRKKDM